MMERDEYGDLIEVPDQGDQSYNPYLDPSNFAPNPPPTAEGGWSNAPPTEMTPGSPNFGGAPEGWTTGDDGLYYFNDPTKQQGPPPTTIGGLPGYGGPSKPDYGFFRGAPGFHFNAPPPFSYQEFSAPTLEQAQNEPGYAFARDEGQRAMQQSAAGRGVLRSGGTLKDLAAWANKFAEQNYGNVYNRNFQTWNGNRNNAFNNYNVNYNNAFNLAKAQYEPEFASWQTEMNLGQSAADKGFDRAYDLYKYDNPSGSEILNAGLS